MEKSYIIKLFKQFESGIRDEYSKIGVHNYYKDHKDEYVNPHLSNIELCLNWVLDKIKIHEFADLSCGNGEVTSYLNKNGIMNSIGIDPYFCDIYKNKTQKQCYTYSFEDIAINGLNINKQVIICSYALHLCPKSYFNQLIYNLSSNCEYFILISPSKYPIIDNYFELVDEIVINRTYCKIFKSNL